MSKIIGDYIIKDKLFVQKPRTYNQAVSKKSQFEMGRFLLCQTITKPPEFPHLKIIGQSMQQVSCKNVLFHYEILETTNNYYVMTEFCNEGILDGYLSKQGINEDQARDYLRQVLNGLKALHEKGIKNCDMSPSSIFLHNGTLKIGQINLATNVLYTLQSDSDFEKHGIQKELIAPEVLQGEQATVISDLYSVGVLYFRFLFGKYPFNATDKKMMLVKIMNEKPLLAVSSKGISSESMDFLASILHYDPKKRMKWSEVYTHPLLKLLNIPNNAQVEQSILMSQFSLNNILTMNNLNAGPFDIKEIKNFYQVQEQGKIQEGPEQSSFLKPDANQAELNEAGIDQFKLQFAMDEAQFIEQRQVAFKQQLHYYLDQRNLYVRFLNALRNTKLLSDDNTKAIEFIIIKTIYLFSNQLRSQLESMSVQVEQIQKDKATNLKEMYMTLKHQIKYENEVIKKQFDEYLKIVKKSISKGLKVSQRFIDNMNDNVSFSHIAELNEQIRQYVEEVVNYKSAQKDQQYTQLHITQLVCCFIYSLQFIMGKNKRDIFSEDPSTYEKRIDEMSMEELKAEYTKQFQNLENIYNEI